MMVRILFFVHCIFSATGLHAQSGSDQFYKEECSRDVCLKVKLIVDSLLAKGIDTILTYKFLPGNGYGGYGKVLWMEKGATNQYLIDTNAERARLRPVVYSKPSRDSTFRFYLKSKVDTVTANPQNEELESVSDYPNHFVWVSIKGDCAS